MDPKENEGKMIDYKDGKITWDNSNDWQDDNYDYNQDILQVEYGQHCVIDVVDYSNGHGGRDFVIMVIDFSQCQTGDDKVRAWTNRYASIPCKDKADLLLQLQRAIDIYPQMIG